ncbi:MAG: RtcB family protein [Myxococcales bacterium]|nr:RtcB family protein [Myxococcales bacterium]MCB9643910.1 RtcB family protein [Myxococcales bacterium]
MKPRELENLGIPGGECVKLAKQLAREAQLLGVKKKQVRATLQALAASPADHVDDRFFGILARHIIGEGEGVFIEREEPAPWQQWGKDLEAEAIKQMQNACRLPVAVSGALMPDAHVGYGLPIGGVLATEGAVIPYAVGVDIACRMKLTVLDLPAAAIEGEKDRLMRVLEDETRFGIGASFRIPHDHEVMDQDWGVTEVTRRSKDKARKQLGSSGSGNHFVEFGTLTIEEAENELSLAPGVYLALLSHSGSRGAGASVASHYSKLAMDLHPELPKELRHLAWLEMDRSEGQEYWAAMQLMGEYAAANHAVIHRSIQKALGVKVLADIENHHNFAWREIHDGKEVYVHRKGATPAGAGVLGIIPGSMSTPAYVVSGKGEPNSLKSASHGAGRLMSRKKAKETFAWSAVKKELRKKGVTLLSAGIDEVPFVYKDIEEVMGAQTDLVDVVARFDPRIVKMAPAGEPPED